MENEGNPDKSGRWWTVALVVLTLAVAGSSGAVILLDNRPLVHDPITNLVPAVMLRQALHERTPAAWKDWMRSTDFRPPLPAVLYQPLMHLLEDQVRAIRLTDLALLLGGLWLIFDIGRRMSGPAAGFLAAFLFAAFPLTQGWSRPGNADPVIWIVLLLLFRVLLQVDLRRPWQAVGLGIAVGLCTATRLLCLVYLVGPFLWVVAFRVRDRRAALGLLLAAAAGAGVAGWWYLGQYHAVMDNLTMSSETQGALGMTENHPLNYLHSGYGWVLLAALVSGGLAARRRWLNQPQLWLVSLWVLVPAVQLVTLWDYWARYLLPAVPQCALLVGVALDRWSAPLPRRRRGVLLAGVLAASLVPVAAEYGGAWSLTPFLPSPMGADGMYPMLQRHNDTGLMAPDTRRYDGLTRALAPLQRGTPVVVALELREPHYTRGLMLARRRPPYPLYDPPDPDMLFGKPPHIETRFLLRVRVRCPGRDPFSLEICEMHEENPWLVERWPQLRARLVERTEDPNGVVFEMYMVPDPI